MVEGIAQLSLELVKIGFIRFIEFRPNIGEVHHKTIAMLFIGTVDAGQRLQEAVILDHTAQIQFFQARRVKAGQQHIVNHQQIYGAFFEMIDFLFPGFFVVLIVQDQGGGQIIVFQLMEHFPCLLRRIADDHAANGAVSQRNTTAPEILHDVFHQIPHIGGMSV